MRTGRSSSAESGFTLLEVLIALVVLGFLIVGLSAGVHGGLALWRAQRRELDKTQNLDAAARILRELLTGIPQVPPAGFAAGAEGRGGIRGTSHAFTFVGDMPTGIGTTLRADIRLELLGQQLVLLWAPHRHELLAKPPQPRETELVGGIKDLELGYWGSRTPLRPPTWLSRWRGPGIPQLIRIHLVFRKGDPRHWPDLIVAPSL
jgi:general secretion pathway protein J